MDYSGKNCSAEHCAVEGDYALVLDAYVTGEVYVSVRNIRKQRYAVRMKHRKDLNGKIIGVLHVSSRNYIF